MEAKLVLVTLLLAGMVVLSTQIPQNRVFREKLPRPQHGKINLDDEVIFLKHFTLDWHYSSSQIIASNKVWYTYNNKQN